MSQAPALPLPTLASLGLDAAALQAWLEQMPNALALVDAPSGLIQWANSAFANATGRARPDLPGQPVGALFDLDLPAFASLAQSGLPRDVGLHRADGRAGHGRLQCQPLRGSLCTLTWWPTDELHQMHELLELTQTFGRLGVWTRDVRTQQGQWDDHMFRFFGLAQSSQPPSFDLALQAVAEEDREPLQQVFNQSMQHAGQYSRRYRLRRPDGTLCHVHSQWVVRCGSDGRPQRAMGVLVDDTETIARVQSHTQTAAQLQLAVELGNILYWRTDLASGKVAFNDRALALYGRTGQAPLSPEELRKIVHPDDLAEYLAKAGETMRDGRPVDMEIRVRNAHGAWRYVLTRRVAQHDGQGRAVAILGVGLDITERVQETRRATVLAQRVEIATQAAAIGFVSIDAGAERPNWNAQMRLIHGVAPDSPEPTVRDWLKHAVHPGDRGRVRKAVASLAQGAAQEFDIDFRLHRPGGELRHVRFHARADNQGEQTVFVGVMIDETEARAGERALRAANERAALAVHGTGLGTWEIDLRSGTTFWDEQMWQLRGLAPRAAAPSEGERRELIHPDDRALVDAKLAQAIADAGPAYYEFRCRLPDGQWRWLASRSLAQRDEQGNTIGRLGVNWDITDTKNAEGARHERAVAERDSRAKSQFLARMSHELRTPLNAVLGFTQMLQNDGESSSAETRRRRLDHIRAAGQHLLSLINDVLDLSSLEGGEVRVQLGPVALGPLVNETLPLVEELARQRKVKLRVGNVAGSAQADATRLRQVLLNLLTNAIKYNAAGGSVTVSAEPRAEWVVLRINDTGRGMSDEQLRHVFEPFNRLGLEQEEIEGTGIGLAIVKALVERMGGSVHVDSTLGVGSVFELRLPLAAPAAEPARGAAGAAAQRVHLVGTRRPGERPTLLYIEDNPVNVLIVEELVNQRTGLQFSAAVDGTSGVARARELRPDLILVDMQLPDFDGIEVLRRLRADPLTKDITCISLSANALRQDVDAALAAGFADYWTKPLDFKAFLTALDGLFGPAAAADMAGFD